MLKVMCSDLATGNRKVFAVCATPKMALGIQKRMNERNEEATKFTGKAIRFVYFVVRSR